MSVRRLWRACVIAGLALVVFSGTFASCLAAEIVLSREESRRAIYGASIAKALYGTSDSVVLDRLFRLVARKATSEGSPVSNLVGPLAPSAADYQSAVSLGPSSDPNGMDTMSQVPMIIRSIEAGVAQAAQLPAYQRPAGYAAQSELYLKSVIAGLSDSHTGWSRIEAMNAAKEAAVELDLIDLVIRRGVDYAAADPVFAAAWEQEVASQTGISLNDSVDAMIAKSGIGSDLIVQECLQSDGRLRQNEDRLTELVREQNAQVSQLAGQALQNMIDLQGYQSSIIGYARALDTDPVVQQAAQSAAISTKDYAEMLSGYKGGVYVLSTVIKKVNPGLGKKVETAGNAVIKIAESINKLRNATGKLKGFAIAAATGNVLAAVTQVFSLFDSNSTSSEYAVLKKEITALRSDISSFRAATNARFDRIDKNLAIVDMKLNQVLNLLDQVIVKLDWNFADIQSSLDTINAQIFQLQNDLRILSYNLYAYEADEYRQDFLSAVDRGIGYTERVGMPMPFQPDYETFESTFWRWAADRSSMEILGGPYSRDYSDQALYSTLNSATGLPLETNINFISQYGYQRLGLAPLSYGRLSNPKAWVTGAEAYVELARECPWYAARISPVRLNDVIARGLDLRDALQNIAYSPTAGGEALFQGILGRYRAKRDAIVSQIGAMEQNYVSTPDYNLNGIDIWGGPDQPYGVQPVIGHATGEESDGTTYQLSLTPALIARSAIPNCVLLSHHFGRLQGVAGELTYTLETSDVHEGYAETRDHSYIWDSDQGAYVWHWMRDVYGFLDMQLLLRLDGVVLKKLRIYSGPIVIRIEMCSAPVPEPDPELPGEPVFMVHPYEMYYIHKNWQLNQNFLQLFEQHSFQMPLTGPEQAAADQKLDPVRDDLQTLFEEHQEALYQKVADEFAVPTTYQLQSLGEQLAGIRELATAYVQLGLPTLLEENDLVRNLLYGEEHLADGADLAALYTKAAQDVAAGLQPAKVDVLPTLNDACDVLEQELEAVFEGISNGDYTARLPQIESTLSELRLRQYAARQLSADDAFYTTQGKAFYAPAPGLLQNDILQQGLSISAALVTGPQHGSVVLNLNGSFTYTPFADFTGTDTFSYRSTDGVVFSDPARVVVSVIPNSESVGAAKSAPDGQSVSAAGVVTAVFPDCFYIESESRAAGIRVIAPEGTVVLQDSLVAVTGTSATSADGERLILADGVVHCGPANVSPLGVSGSTANVCGGAGLDATGLLVRTYGRVVEVEPSVYPAAPSWFRLDNGSGVVVTCTAGPNTAVIDPLWHGDYAGITGILTRQLVDGCPTPVLRMRASDEPVIY